MRAPCRDWNIRRDQIDGTPLTGKPYVPTNREVRQQNITRWIARVFDVRARYPKLWQQVCTAHGYTTDVEHVACATVNGDCPECGERDCDVCHNRLATIR
jgi:hypothetical protein